LGEKFEMPPVTIYTRRFCGYCTAAKSLLEEMGVPFDEIDATSSPEKRNEMIQRSSRYTFPQIFIGSHHVGGCDDLYAAKARGELQILLSAEEPA
jgi:glutaredoxin 3